MRLQGKISFISGGARGIGAATARLFAQEGAQVAIGDILEEEDWRQAIAATVARFGRLDVLVNNAGINRPGGIEETSVETWDEVMAVNARGVFLGTKVAIPEMRKAGGGSIVNVSSELGIVGADTSNPAYQASKGAVRIFTKTAAIQHARDGIRVNSVHPGPVLTPMIAERYANEAYRRRTLSGVPLGRIGQPEDIAYGVLYLASDESSFVTGSELVIDGGLIAQ